MTNLLLKAAKRKYRFQTPRGPLNVEQLFDLSQQDLHNAYLEHESKIQSSKGLLGRKGNSEIDDKLEILKSVFQEIVSDRDKTEQRNENTRLKQTLLAAADNKEIEEMTSGKSAKQMRKEAAKL